MGHSFKKVPNNRKAKSSPGLTSQGTPSTTWYGSKEQLDEFRKALDRYIENNGYE